MSETDRLSQIEQALADENDYFGCAMTPEQIAKAALIKLSKESPVDDVEHVQNCVGARERRERKEAAS